MVSVLVVSSAVVVSLSMIFTVLIMIVFVGLTFSWMRISAPGRALVVHTPGGLRIVRGRMLALPVLHVVEEIDLTPKTVAIEKRGPRGLICADNLRADIEVVFYLRVGERAEQISEVVESLGCERASDPQALAELFEARFSEALKSAGKQLDFEEIYFDRMGFRDHLLELLGYEHGGFVLEDIAITYLDQTPAAQLDRQNVLDSQGLEKIAKIVEPEMQRISELHNEMRRMERARDLAHERAGAEVIERFEREQRELEGRAEREIQGAKEGLRRARRERERVEELVEKERELDRDRERREWEREQFERERREIEARVQAEIEEAKRDAREGDAREDRAEPDARLPDEW